MVIDRLERRLAQRLASAPLSCALGSSDDRPPSILMNHCDVARKITGLWQRQQCGYWCENDSRCQSRPRSLSASSTLRIRIEDALPPKSSDRVEKVAARADRRVDVEAVLHAGVEVVGAVARRGVHRARAGIERHVVAERRATESRSYSGWRKRMPSSSAPFIRAIGWSNARPTTATPPPARALRRR